jgi:P27 family predicted phage terminase small subunit
MGQRGPAPTPTVLRLVRGNPSRRGINKREPKPSGALRVAPPNLPPRAAEIWAHAIEHAPNGLLKQLDESVMLTWCVARAHYEDAMQRVARTGLMVKSPNGHAIQNPFLAILNKQALIMLKAAQAMGFTPASRSGIALEPDDDDGNALARKYGLD